MSGLGSRVSQVLVGVPGGLVGTALAGGVRRRVGPLVVSVRMRPSLRGGGTVHLPPLGEITLDTHDGPVGVDITVDSIDESAIQEAVRRPDMLQDLGREVRDQVPRDLGLAAARSLGAGAAGGAAAGLLAFRRVRPAMVSSVSAAAAILAGYAVSARSFRREALRDPRLAGLLASVPSLKGMVAGMVDDFGVYGDQLAKLVRNVTTIYGAVSNLPVVPAGEDLITVLHISDLHLAPHAWKLVEAVADQFDVDVVVDSGDTTDFGSQAENAYLAAIPRLARPYVWVRGNHDSEVTQEAMAALPNVVVLEGQVAEVAGLRFLGAGDPVFTPGKSHVPMDLEAEAAQAADVAAVARDVGGVDLIVFHHPGPWKAFDGLTGTVLAGHRHARKVECAPSGTRLMVLGSTGGGGLRAMQGRDVPTNVELAVLYFDRGSRRLVAWDDLRVGGIGLASAAVERHMAEAPAASP